MNISIIFLIILIFICVKNSKSKVKEDFCVVYRLVEQERFRNIDAVNGVAVGPNNFYSISDKSISKCHKLTGRTMSRFIDFNNKIDKLNDGLILYDRLICVGMKDNSNYLFYFNTDTLELIGKRKLKLQSELKWIDIRDGLWWGSSSDKFYLFDGEWNVKNTWEYPYIVSRLIKNNGGIIGGTFGPNKYVYVTGGKRSEIYVLQVPRDQKGLRYKWTISTTDNGQGTNLIPKVPKSKYKFTNHSGIAGRGITFDGHYLYGVNPISKQVVKMSLMMDYTY